MLHQWGRLRMPPLLALADALAAAPAGAVDSATVEKGIAKRQKLG